MTGGYLALADGSIWQGVPFGALGRRTGEVVFNTGMTGYQEILTDPSYNRQIVVMTAPQVGNTGINAEDDESRRMWVAGFVVRRASRRASSWRATATLDEALAAMEVPGLSGIDCRGVVRHLRDHGAMPGAVVTDGGGADDALRLARSAPDINGLDLVGEVTCGAPYPWREAAEAHWYNHCRPTDLGADAPAVTEGPAAPGATSLHLVVFDFGVKRNILRLLASRGCRVTVVPARTTAAAALDLEPDGIVLSNGPGDPAALVDVVDIVASLMGRVPILGICLGHQLLGLALGGRTYKLKFGHRGSNQPVRGPARTVAISSHNHGFALAEDSWPPGDGVEITHTNLNDGCVEGLAAPDRLAFGVQYHPEAAPGPHDALGIIEAFLARVRAGAGAGAVGPPGARAGAGPGEGGPWPGA